MNHNSDLEERQREVINELSGMSYLLSIPHMKTADFSGAFKCCLRTFEVEEDP